MGAVKIKEIKDHWKVTMPSMACECGHRIICGEIPCLDEWLLISDVAYDRFAGSVDAEEIFKEMLHMLLCPKCGRLWVYWDGFSKPAAVYARQ